MFRLATRKARQCGAGDPIWRPKEFSIQRRVRGLSARHVTFDDRRGVV